ncbi:MAG: acyltransferase [Chloroflexota bacterium]
MVSGARVTLGVVNDRSGVFNPNQDDTPAPSAATFVHSTADISAQATLGPGCRVWRLAHVRERARIGAECVIGAGAYVGADVTIGDRCKVQNNALLYEGVTLEDGVFVGPQVCFTNDYLPRAVNPDLSLKSADDWTEGRTLVRQGASIGAASVVVTGVTVGCWALVGAGSVVTHDVPDHALVFGNPARVQGWVCFCARRLTVSGASGWCQTCQRTVALSQEAAASSTV